MLGRKDRPNIVHNYTNRVKLTKINCYLLDVDSPNELLSELMANENIKGEIWKDIDNTSIRWQVSNYGRYRHRRTSKSNWKYCVVSEDIYGYPRIQITLNKKCVCLRAHKLVADYFIGPKPSDDHCVCRRIPNLYKNDIWNLYYGLKKDMLNSTSRGSFGAVFKIDCDTGEIIDEYENIADAAKDNFTTKSNIREAIVGCKNRVTAVGYKWCYAKDYDKEIKFKEEIQDE